MKSTKDFRAPSASEDSIRKAMKLEPIKKSGKERHHLFSELDEDDDQIEYIKRESVLDYFDDQDE